uniref:CCHC-type domain-containing protein n=1 Tax=Sinocyclocheilus anshuiensis TaxID=1608454 RepID=A0A671LRM1_9TELE
PLLLRSFPSSINKLLQIDSNTASTSLLQNTLPQLNPAEVSNLQAAFAYQSEVLKGYQDQLDKLQSVNEHLTHYIQSLPSTTPKTVNFALPDKFDGSAEQCRGFVCQVKIYFDNQEDKFQSDEKKCAFMMTLLSGKAIDWAAAVWETDVRFRRSFDYFIQQLREVFEYPAGGKDISTQILHMSQGNRTAAEYAILFRTLAAQSGWNDVSLKAVFQQSLNTDLQAELACKGENVSFSDFVTLTIKIDNLMRQAPRRRNTRGFQQVPPAINQPMTTSTTKPGDEPMQLGLRGRQLRLCFYCGEAGHRSQGCPHKVMPYGLANAPAVF